MSREIQRNGDEHLDADETDHKILLDSDGTAESVAETDESKKKKKNDKDLDNKDEESSSESDKIKHLKAIHEEIKKQTSHNLFCSNCSKNITTTAELIKAGEEKYPYNQTLSIVLEIPLRTFKLPSVKFDYNHKDGSKSSRQRILLALVPLLVLVIGLWFFPSSNTPSPTAEVKLEWLKFFISNKFIFVTLLFMLLAILALYWYYNKDPGNGNNEANNLNGITVPDVNPTPDEVPKIKSTLWEDKKAKLKELLPKEVEILKSIVYGGLAESITSLGVVSSAAASGASTLNVLFLGVANLWSGFFLIGHKLFELKNDDNKYKEKLGNKDHKILHGIVVLASLVTFAVIPPLVYAFSFKIVDKGPYGQAAVVVGICLACVMLLSYAKAVAFEDKVKPLKFKEKLKTVGIYTGIAIAVCVFSYGTSQLLKDCLEKYDIFGLAAKYLNQ